MSEGRALTRADQREQFLVARDLKEVGDHSPLGLRHQLCVHNVDAATCMHCIYGEAGNKVLADMGAVTYAERVNSRVQRGDAVDPVETAEEAYRSGFAAGVGAHREADTVQGVLAARGGSGEAKDLLRALVALEAGQITKSEALGMAAQWASEMAKAIGAENGLKPAALTGGSE